MSTVSAPMEDPIGSVDSTSRRSRPSWFLLASGTATALVIGGGAFSAMAVTSAGGDQPNSVMPASTALYAQVDIDPSVEQKFAALHVFDGVDSEAVEAMRDGRGREALFDLAASQPDSPFADRDYEADIEPWLGDRLGMGAVPGGEDELIPLLALQVTDEAVAEEFLAEILAEEGVAGEVDYFFRGDYVVLTDAQSLPEIQIDVDEGTLANDPTFSGDMESLGQQGVVSMWADLAAIQASGDNVRQKVVDTLGETRAHVLTEAEVDLRGRLAATARFDQEAIEVSGRAIDTGAEVVGGEDAGALIGALPNDTVIAVGVEQGDEYVSQGWALFEEAMGEQASELQQEAAAQGLALPGDLSTILGDSAVLSAGPGVGNVMEMLSGGGVPVGYSARTDADAAATLVDKVLTSADQELDVATGDSDGVFTVAGSQTYYDELVTGGNLADTPGFTAAIPEAEGADMAVYANLNAVESLYLPMVEDAQARTMLESLATVGMSATPDGQGGGSFWLRLAFDE